MSSPISKKSNAEKISPGDLSSFRRVIAVTSGKGGVGKSMVTCLLAVLARRRGLRVGILDADLTGPSIPRAFGVKEPLTESQDGFYPATSKTGIEIVSANLMLPSEDTPLIWRGSLLSDLTERFFSGTVYDDLDLLLVDCPPGTGDVPLTVFTRFPLYGAVAVTSPQEAVTPTVEKSLRMAEKVGVPILSLVENFSYVECPRCHGKHALFGAGKLDETAAKHHIPVTAKMPISQKLAGAADRGMIELFEGDFLDAVCDVILKGLEE